MKNILQVLFFLLCANISLAANALTVAPTHTESDTIKPKKGIIKRPDNLPPVKRPDIRDPKAAETGTPPVDNTTKDIKKAGDDKATAEAKKAAEKAAAEAKKAEEKRLKEEKEKKDPPKVHLFAWLSLGLGIVAIAGLIGYFVMPVLGFLSVSAILASIFGYLASKKIKKEPLKWKGLPFTTFGGMSILALLAVIVVWLIGFFAKNSGI
jgi:hypothetical protein